MDVNSESIYELRNFFIDGFMVNDMEISTKLLDQLTTQLNYILGSELVAIFLYNDWKEEFELTTKAPLNQEKFNHYVLSSLNQGAQFSTVVPLDVDIYDQPSKLSSYLLNLNKNGKVQGLIVVSFAEVIQIDAYQECFDKIINELSFLFQYLGGFNKIQEKANKYELLYHLSTKIYSSIDMKDVLKDVIETLKEVYPLFNYKLLLAQDYQEDWHLPIEYLNYNENSINEASVQAFLTGEINIEKGLSTSQLNAPLKGKQGVYGVLQVYVPHADGLLEDGDVNFLKHLANTTGKAVENATLFQQSKQLITDLQLINDTSHMLNSNLKLLEMISLIKQQITYSFSAEEIGFFLFKEEECMDIVEGSTDYFLSSESSSFLDFIIPKIKTEKDSLFISEFKKSFPNLDFPYQSVMAIPMFQIDQVTGAIIVMQKQPYSFTFESFKLIQSLVQHSSLAIANSILRERLEKLVITDYLTKLYSRNYLDERLNEHIKTDEQGVFLLIDIDDFKSINDSYGHDTGDRLLIQVATIIKNNLNEEGFAARWGGEELAIYLPQATADKAMDIGQKLVGQVKSHTTPIVTISIGLAYWHKNRPIKPQQLFDQADQALYKAKELGKNRVVEA